MKAVKFMAFCGTMQESKIVGPIREFCESHDGHEKFAALCISP